MSRVPWPCGLNHARNSICLAIAAFECHIREKGQAAYLDTIHVHVATNVRLSATAMPMAVGPVASR